MSVVRFRPGPPRNIKTTFGWFFHLVWCDTFIYQSPRAPKMIKQKLKMFITPFCESTPACLLVMVQGNIWLATIGHLQKAVETGLITGIGVLILSFFTHRWLGNKYVVAAITGGMCFIADLLAHPSHFGDFTTEAIVTGVITGMISLAVNFVGKKLFVHGRSKFTRM